MADTPTTAGETPATAPTTPPPGAAEDPGQEHEEEPFDKDRAMATIQKLRSEAKLATKQVKEYATQQKLAEDAKLSEQERLSKRVQELESRESSLQQAVRERTLRYEVVVEAQKLGIVDPDAAYRLMDQKALEFDDDGTPTNTETVLARLIKARPWLQHSTSAPGAQPPTFGPTNPSTRGRGPDGARIYRASELNDPTFFQANRADITRAMNEGRVLPDQ